MTTITTHFAASDDDGARLLQALAQFPEWSVERAEMEGQLFMVLARAAWRRADQIQTSNAKARKRIRKDSS